MTARASARSARRSWLRIGLLRFPQRVEILGGRTSADCEAALQGLVRRPLQKGPVPLFLGHIGNGHGKLWHSRFAGLHLPARSLKFDFIPLQDGCLLKGELELVLPLRLFLATYILFCVLIVSLAIWSVAQHAVPFVIAIRTLIAALVASAIFTYGYGWFAIFVSKKAENRMLKLIRHIMADEQSAAVAIDLLSNSAALTESKR